MTLHPRGTALAADTIDVALGIAGLAATWGALTAAIALLVAIELADRRATRRAARADVQARAQERAAANQLHPRPRNVIALPQRPDAPVIPIRHDPKDAA